jgi:hypothetical protein
VRQDGDAIVIDIPMTFRHKYGRKEIVPRAGAEDQARLQSTTPSPLTLAVARAFRWQEMIETGQAKSNCDLARKLKLDQSHVARTIRLASLAPEVIESILGGHEPEGAGLNLLRQDLPLLWEEQRRELSRAS